MASCFGQDVIVTIEQPDGQVFRGKCSAVSLKVFPGFLRVGEDEPHWNLELHGRGDLFWTTANEFTHRVTTSRSMAEWRCDFCGSVNLREHRSCQKCNAARSFLYE